MVCLTADEEQALLAKTRAGTTEHRIAERAKIALLVHQGKTNLEIAEQFRCRLARPPDKRRPRILAEEGLLCDSSITIKDGPEPLQNLHLQFTFSPHRLAANAGPRGRLQVGKEFTQLALISGFANEAP
jgi:hypothetical protein